MGTQQPTDDAYVGLKGRYAGVGTYLVRRGVLKEQRCVAVVCVQGKVEGVDEAGARRQEAGLDGSAGHGVEFGNVGVTRVVVQSMVNGIVRCGRKPGQRGKHTGASGAVAVGAWEFISINQARDPKPFGTRVEHLFDFLLDGYPEKQDGDDDDGHA